VPYRFHVWKGHQLNINILGLNLSISPSVTWPGGVDLNAKGAPTIADALYKGITPEVGSPGHKAILQELQSGSLSEADLKGMMNDPKVPSWLKDMMGAELKRRGPAEPQGQSNGGDQI
jgi:hypothetical protein